MRKNNIQLAGLVLELNIATFYRCLIMFVMAKKIFSVQQVIPDKINDTHLFGGSDFGIILVHFRDIAQ